MRGKFLSLALTLTLVCNASDAIEVTPEVGGSNLVVYDVGRYPQDPSDANWAKVRFVIPHFHENKPKVLNAIKEMYKSGQRKISLLLWYIPSYQIKLSNPTNTPCITQNHVICLDNGKMPELMAQNFKEILKAIDDAGFETIVIRLGAQWKADPFSWPEGPKGEEYFKTFTEDSWQFLSSTHDLVDGLKLKANRVYDMGGELMGHPYTVRPWVSQYLSEMLRRYKAKYGTADSVGFSFNFGSWMGSSHREAVRHSLRLMMAQKFNPGFLGIDVYERAGSSLPELARVLREERWSKDYPIIIQETFYNSIEQAQAIRRAKGTLNIRYILQWPTNPGGGHFQTDLPLKYDAYLR